MSRKICFLQDEPMRERAWSLMYPGFPFPGALWAPCVPPPVGVTSANNLVGSDSEVTHHFFLSSFYIFLVLPIFIKLI